MNKLMKQGIVCIVLGGSLLLTACGSDDAAIGQAPVSAQPTATQSAATATEVAVEVVTADTGIADQLIGFWETEWTFDASANSGSHMWVKIGLERSIEFMGLEDGDVAREVVEFRLNATGQLTLRQQVYVGGESVFVIVPEVVIIDGSNFYTSAQTSTWRRTIHELNENEMVLESRGGIATWRRVAG